MVDRESSLDESKEGFRCIETLLKVERPPERKGDVEAICVLAEDTGSCRFKVDGWTDPISLSSDDDKTLLLRTFLVVLWQLGRFTQLPCDPLDLRVARIKKETTDAENQIDKKEVSTKLLEKTSSANMKNQIVSEDSSAEVTIAADTEDQKEEKDSLAQPMGGYIAVDSSATAENIEKNDRSKKENKILSVEDLPQELVGPLDIDMQRIDYYNPLFGTYRKSTGQRKTLFLESKHLSCARKLSGIDDWDYKFSQAVLAKAAPSLEELDMGKVRHVGTLKLLMQDLSFPKLKRLNIWVSSIEPEETPFLFAPPCAGHRGLRWLRCRLPRPALQSLLRANAKSLLELHLEVGAPRAVKPYLWPMGCEDLHTMLGECGFSCLRRLVLLRGACAWHTRAACYDQVREVRQVLPEVLVECEFCRPG